MVDLARFIGGDVVMISACAQDLSDDRKAVLVNFRYRNGAVGCLNMNSGHSWRDCFEQAYASGSGAALLIDASKSVEVMALDRRFAQGEDLDLYGWSSRYYVSGNMSGWAAGGHYTGGYWGELKHFARACLGLEPPSSSLHDGLEAMRFIEAVMVSTREEGRSVCLDEMPYSRDISSIRSGAAS